MDTELTCRGHFGVQNSGAGIPVTATSVQESVYSPEFVSLAPF